MRQRVLILCLLFVFMLISTTGYCDRATPLAVHLKRLKKSYRANDFNATIIEACNAIYHERQKSTAYSYLGRAYEELDEVELAIASYMRYMKYCKTDNIKKARKKIESLKKKASKEELGKVIKNMPDRVLTSKFIYKRNRIYRVRDYIYNPAGQLIEEKYCRPNGSNEFKKVYKYSQDGQVEKILTYDDSGILEFTETIIYKGGNKAYEETRDPAGAFLGKKAYMYDLVGNLKNILTYNRKEELLKKKSFYYNEDALYEVTAKDYMDPYSLENYTARNLYKKGNLIAKEINYKAGVFEKVKYVYRAGKLKSEIFFSAEDIPVMSKKYVYNSNGDLREMAEYKIFNKRKESLKSKVSYNYSTQ